MKKRVTSRLDEILEDLTDQTEILARANPFQKSKKYPGLLLKIHGFSTSHIDTTYCGLRKSHLILKPAILPTYPRLSPDNPALILPKTFLLACLTDYTP